MRAARIAGEILLSHFGSARTGWHKGEIDLVTNADAAAELAMEDEIRRPFPDDRMLAEEGPI